MFEQRSGADDDPATERASETEPEQDAALIRRAVAGMESLSAEQRRLLAGYAYVLVRVARADGVMNEAEVAAVEESVIEAGGLERAQGVLVAALASSVNSLFGATEDFAFTREFARQSSPQQLQRLLRACVVVGAADGTITSAERTELYEIGRELGFGREEVDAILAQLDSGALEAPDRVGGS